MVQSIKIYRIDKDNYRLKDATNREAMISVIIRNIRLKYKLIDKWDISFIPKFPKDGLIYYLFHQNFNEKESDWTDFLPHQLIHGISLNTRNLTLLLFIDNGIDLYVVVGGKGYEAVIKYLDHSFGMTIVSKLLNPDEDIIVSINSRGLTGVRAGLSEQYRRDFKLVDYVRFGKVPVEVHLVLSQAISDEYFYFLQGNKERIRIHAGKSFKVKKNLTFEELHILVTELGNIMERAPNDYLSTYIEVRDHHKIKNEYAPLLINALYNDLGYVHNPKSTDKRFKFDFCDPNKVREFYEADEYILKEKIDKVEGKSKYAEFGRVSDRDDIYGAVMRRAIDTIEYLDLFKFRAYIQGVMIQSRADGKKSTSASFTFHFTTEFPYEGKSIFLVDKKWYILNSSFIDDLKYQCVQTLKNQKLPKDILNIPWDKSVISTEKMYNLQYDSMENYIVLDTLTPEGIELCDILYIEDERVYLIHVKYGFDSSLRELSNQIMLSARRLYDDTKPGKYKYIDKIYERAKDKSSVVKKYTIEQFRELFNRNKTYVFAFASQLQTDNLVEESIDEYESNIARYSLVQCSKDMQIDFGYSMNIHQIRRSDLKAAALT